MGDKISDNKKIIDVLIVIDTETILDNYDHSLDPQKPVKVPNNPNLIYIISRKEKSIYGQTGNELTISAKTLDTIRWRAISLSLNSDSAVIPYKFIAPFGQQVISNPELLLCTVDDPLPNPDDPYNPIMQTIKKYFYNSTVKKPGRVPYKFYFLIVDQQGNKKGYYYWNPRITLNA